MLCSLEECLGYKTEQHLPLYVARIFYKLYLQFLLWWVSSEFCVWIACRSTWWKILSVEQNCQFRRETETDTDFSGQTREHETWTWNGFQCSDSPKTSKQRDCIPCCKTVEEETFRTLWEILPPDTNSRLSTGRNLNSIGVIWCMVSSIF